jgi:hypothetical protein
MIALAGGMPGAENFQKNEILKKMLEDQKSGHLRISRFFTKYIFSQSLDRGYLCVTRDCFETPQFTRPKHRGHVL